MKHRPENLAETTIAELYREREGSARDLAPAEIVPDEEPLEDAAEAALLDAVHAEIVSQRTRDRR
ncbi:MAG: hypothetical protein KC466_00195 [Myxococcales bacterium]|nr:hypothetical protein [Myxococcales bacterium]